MNLLEAKQLLKERGYKLIKEGRKLYEAVTYSPEEIFDDLWDRKFSYWDDAEYNEFKQAFIAGYTGRNYKGSSDAKYAYDDGISFCSCDTNQRVKELLAELTSDEWY
jgi:hypothetical protein